jgi:FixJ family two-component response regulator
VSANPGLNDETPLAFRFPFLTESSSAYLDAIRTRPQRDSIQSRLPPYAVRQIMDQHPRIYVAVVDDDESVCRSISRLLRASHFEPITYLSAEALLADTKHPAFDCLVLDIQLGGITGLELSQRLRAVKNNTPVVFITAHDDPTVREEAEAAGCAGFFRKTDPGELIINAIVAVTSRDRKS